MQRSVIKRVSVIAIKFFGIDPRNASSSADLPQDQFCFAEKTKTIIIGSTGSLAVVALIIVLILPSALSRLLAIQNANNINRGTGRWCMYLSKINITVMFDCVLPMVLILGSPKMRKSIWREIKSRFQ